MSRPAAPTAVPAVAPRAFLTLAVGFLLLYAGILATARQQRAARSALESVVPLPPLLETAPAKPQPTPTEP